MGPPQIEMVIHFTDDEVGATQEAAERWYQVKGRYSSNELIRPAHQNVVKIGLEGERFWVDDPKSSHLPPQAYLFRGRAYAASILEEDPAARILFDRLPGIFWFDQFRNLATTPGSREVESNGGLKEEPVERVAYAVGISRLRQFLNGWKLQRLQKIPRPGQVDYLLELKTTTSGSFRSVHSLIPSRCSGVAFLHQRTIIS